MSCEYGCRNGICLEEKSIPLSENLYINDIVFGREDRFIFDDQMYFSLTLMNQGETEFDDLGISIVIYDLGLYFKFGDVDLDEGERVTLRKSFDIPQL